MVVTELIELLKKLPQDATIIHLDNEGDAHEANDPHVIKMHLLDPAVFGAEYYSHHSEKDCALCKNEKHKLVTTVRI